jgi:hypothetical protein
MACGVAASILAGVASAGGSWCMGLGNLGPIHGGMTIEEVLRLADFSGMERRHAAEECWYLSYGSGQNQKEPAFRLMIISGRVARIEIVGASTLRTFSGVHLGSTEDELARLFGGRLDVQPHKYDERGHTLTFRSSDGAQGLRFETSSGKVTAMQSGPWEHLHYVEGCS